MYQYADERGQRHFKGSKKEKALFLPQKWQWIKKH